MLGSMFSFITPVQKFGACSPKRIWGQKHAEFGSNWISPEWIEISKIEKLGDRQCFLPRLAEKFGELWSTKHGDLEVQSYPPNRLFLKTIFLLLMGAASPNFIHATEWPILASTHSTGDGVPAAIFTKGWSKIGLKCSVLASITFELRVVASRNFTTWCAAGWGW